jgi:DhnA family fructose-bisphosphate aldolase class Ia
MLGSEIRFKRLLPDGQRIVILPLDHGEFQGPRKGLINPTETLRALSGYDAVLLSPGMLIRSGELLARKRSVSIIVRLNFNSDYCFQWDYHDGAHARTLSPAGALALGADVGLASIAIGTGVPATDVASAEIFARLAEEARAVGLPSSYEPADFHDLIKRSCRIASELGADFVKTYYTGPAFEEVVAAAPVPIIVLGAGKEDEASALRKAAAGISAGARGVVFGRNVFESNRPQAFLDALATVVRDGQAAATAAEAFGFAS